MTTNPFDEIGPDVFEDRDRLREDYIPEEIVKRDEEIDQLIHGLSPVLNGYSPDHIFTAGPHGSGKTVCASFVLDQLEEKISHNNTLHELKTVIRGRLDEECQNGAFSSDFDSADELLSTYKSNPEELLKKYEAMTGKSLATHIPVDALPPEYTDVDEILVEALSKTLPDEQVDLTVKWVNCAGVSTGYQLAIRIANAFRSRDEEMLAESGYAEQRVYDEMFDEIERAVSTNGDDQQGTVLLVLDEIGIVQELDTLFYKLTRARGKGGHLKDAKLGTICLSNNTTFRDQFTTRTESSLTAKHIDFDAYDASELQSVLSVRADEAFRGEALTEDVIPLCAGMATSRGGDARFALQLLLEAGDIAIQENDERVSEDHVREAERQIEQENVVGMVERYQAQPQVVLLSLIECIARGDGSVSTEDLYERYEDLTTAGQLETVGYRQILNHLKMFDEDDLIVKNGTEANAPDIVSVAYPTERIRGAIPDDIITRVLGEDADTGPQTGSGTRVQSD